MKRVLRSQSDYRSTLLRNQLTSLVLFETVTTTEAKASALEPYVNHFFNKVKAGDLTAKRLAHQTLLDQNAVKKVFEEILPRFKAAETTFIRSYRLMPRRGDAAAQTMVAFIRPLEVKATPKEKIGETKTKSAAKTSSKNT